MKITREINGQIVNISLTGEEIAEAHAEFVKNWMAGTAQEIDENLTDRQAAKIGEAAYDIYCSGNGETEYESVEKAVENCRKKNEGEKIYRKKICRR